MSTDITERKRQEAEIIRRATEMEVAARVSAASTSILDVDELLLNVANLTKESFGLYHAHVYLLDAANEYLVLAAGAGEAGRIMKEQGRRIALNNEHSLVARAAREKTGAIVNDVSKEPDFLPNPLLPATRSEMAIPMIVGDHVIGVLDVQADIINRFDADDVRVKSTLANQIAVAVENARAFESVERSREEVSRVYNLSVDMIGTASHTGYFQELNPAWSATLGWSMEELKSRPFIEFVHPDDRQPTLDEYARQIRSGAASISFENRYLCKDGSFRWLSWNAVPFAQEGLTYFVTRDVTTEKETEESIRAARNRAETLASINAALSQAANESEILDAIAPLAEAQGVWASSLMYPSMKDGQLLGAEAVSVRMGDGQNLTQSIGTTFISLAEFPLFNLISNYPDDLLFIEDWETSPLGNEAERQYTQNVGIRAAILIRLRIGQEWHGLLTFNWSEPKVFSQDLRDIFAAAIPTATSVVAARRAFLESQRQRTEAEKRAIELAIVAEVSSTAATQLNPTELLSSVVDLTKGAFNLYHAHIYLADEENANLVLAAGAGEAGRIMLQQGRRIPMDRVNSLVAQAARERYPVISNDVTQESNFLPNPLLPDTRSEMSVPMVVGDKLIGVLDVQASQINRFTESDALIFRTLGDQLAIAIENARAFQLQQETAERLREVDRLKSQFLANMSHELRTPLNSIIGYSEVMLDGLDGDLTEDAIEDVEAIYNGGKHLLSIINDVLDLAKIEAGQMHMDRREADVATVIEDVVSTVQILIKDKPDLVLEVHVPENLPTVYGDMLRMKQMMMNLVNNAIKFTESGSVRIEAAPHNGHEVAIRVTDTGIGMSEREVAELFQQFHQVDGSPTRRAGGTGLGLVITRHLIHMHEGEIYVESEKGVGSSFWFTLPIFAERMAERA
ncbi:MAG: GAF domain-containing protein [Anaerolineae bacterium]|nr:GAF domain-containing protein [Anaerolineae bacterium]